MILTLFIIFISIALILTIMGFFMDVPLFAFAGTTILFLIGLNLLTSPLTYVSGENMTFDYGTNLSNAWASDGGTIPSSSDVYVFTSVSQDVYSEYDDSVNNRYGFYIMAVGILGFVLTFFRM